ncbi:MAG: DUF692 domain-containing protein [Zetaproteobacteria bacterium]|nr:DUF692 domain-containing protein [Zetaproteobacteria bacterium]
MDTSKISGVGLGLRDEFVSELLTSIENGCPPNRIGWLEILADNYFSQGGRHLHRLASLREHWPVVLHSVGLNVGSAEGPNMQKAAQMRRLVQEFRPAWVSDHLAWTGISGKYIPDLLPLPYTVESVEVVAANIRLLREYLDCPFIIENISSYACFQNSEMTEVEFLLAVVQQAGCGILLDLNNIYVNSQNHGYDAKKFLQQIPRERVVQFHIAGHTSQKGFLLDTHGAAIAPDVWDLATIAAQLFPGVPVCLERDNDIPALGELLRESEQAADIFYGRPPRRVCLEAMEDRLCY